MNDARPQHKSEQPQLELRFDIGSPELLQELTSVEPEVGRQLSLLSFKRMIVDPTNKYELEQFTIYRDGIRGMAQDGRREFDLSDYVRPIYYRDEPRTHIIGLGFRVKLEQWVDNVTILRPPLYGPRPSYDPITRRSAEAVLRAARQAAYLPVKLELSEAVPYDQEYFEHLQRIMKMGTWVTGMLLQPYRPERTLRSVS